MLGILFEYLGDELAGGELTKLILGIKAGLLLHCLSYGVWFITLLLMVITGVGPPK